MVNSIGYDVRGESSISKGLADENFGKSVLIGPYTHVLRSTAPVTVSHAFDDTNTL